MKTYTETEIQEALKAIETMEQIEMCRLYRFAPEGSEIYFRKDLPTSRAFTFRLFQHFNGFTHEISKELGW